MPNRPNIISRLATAYVAIGRTAVTDEQLIAADNTRANIEREATDAEREAARKQADARIAALDQEA